MRIVLPLVALFIIVLVIAWPQFTDAPRQFGFKPAQDTVQDTVQDAVGQQMVNAHFTGTDSSGNPFTVTADTAAQVKQSPDVLKMTVPKADITTKGGAWVALSAKTGFYDKRIERLDLTNDVLMFHDSGYEFKTSAASIDLKSSIAEGAAPITGHGPGGSVSASGFRIAERGAVLFFSGKSRMEFFPRTQKLGGGGRK